MGGGFFITVFMTLAFAFAFGLAALALPAGAAAVLGLVAAAGFLAASAAGLSGGVWGAGTS